MSCERFATALNDRAAGAALEPRLAIHVRQCESCRMALQARSQLMSGFDCELRRALAIEASGDFAARVRTRIALQPAASGWWPNRLALPLAACLLILLGGVVLWQESGRSGDPAPVTATRSDPAQPEARSAVDVRRTFSAPPRAAQPSRRDRRVRTAPASTLPASEPEVLVPPAQAEAIRRLVRAVADGRLRVAPPEPATDASPVVITPVAVPPVSVAPIEIAAPPAEKVGR